MPGSLAPVPASFRAQCLTPRTEYKTRFLIVAAADPGDVAPAAIVAGASPCAADPGHGDGHRLRSSAPRAAGHQRHAAAAPRLLGVDMETRPRSGPLPVQLIPSALIAAPGRAGRGRGDGLGPPCSCIPRRPRRCSAWLLAIVETAPGVTDPAHVVAAGLQLQPLPPFLRSRAALAATFALRWAIMA